MHLQVKAVDNGRPQKDAECQIIFTVVTVPTETSNPPQFTQNGVKATVMENDDVGHMVALLLARDNDSSVWYGITGRKNRK